MAVIEAVAFGAPTLLRLFTTRGDTAASATPSAAAALSLPCTEPASALSRLV